MSTQEASDLLGVTAQRVRRLAENGAIDRVARGLINRHSVERYLISGGGGRTRVRAENTAWGAIALLSRQPVEWLTSPTMGVPVRDHMEIASRPNRTRL
jgi:hypothetical protein